LGTKPAASERKICFDNCLKYFLSMIEKTQYFHIKIIFLFAIIALLGLSFLSYMRINNLIEESKLINHTNLVKLSLEKTFATLSDKESNQRGYIFTNDSVFLTRYFAANSIIISELNTIDSLTKENPSQQQNLIVLRTAINEKMEMMKHNLVLFQTQKVSIPDRLKGKALMDNVRTQINKMENEEDKLLTGYSASLSKSAFITPLFTIISIIGSLIILIASYFKIILGLKISYTLKTNVEQRTNELLQANKELVYQNEEKEKRAAELVVANKELAFQNEEKEKRAAELVVANKELAFQNEEKEKRAAELIIANKELESFTYISSHDLQEPLRQIQSFASRIIDVEKQNLSDKGKDYFERMNNAANRMQTLIADLLAYSRTTTAERTFENTDLNKIVEQVKTELKEIIDEKHATIEVGEMCNANVVPFQIRQLMQNLIGNSLKFFTPGIPPHIKISSCNITYSKLNSANLTPGKEYCRISISDNGIGFEPEYKDRIFEVFQRLHDKQKIPGTGIGLAIVKKIVENHKGSITATSELNKGATFDVYIPVN
jgi:signal transduction histidine kinase